MKFPLDKYRYYVNGNKVIAVSTYAGRTVKGTASCHPSDIFDLEKGKLIAAAKCNEKIAARRYARAQKKFLEAVQEMDKAAAQVAKMQDYKKEAFIAYNEAAIECDNIIKDFS